MSATQNRPPRNNNLWVGLIVLIIGFGLLMDKMNIFFLPSWLFSWPMILIVIGLIIGVKKRFADVSWLILVLIGSFFLVDDIHGFEYLRRYAVPLGIIIIGFFLVFRALSARSNRVIATSDPYNRSTADRSNTARATAVFSSNERTGTGGEDYIDLTAVFGGIKKRIYSKSFKGGQFTNIFGGTELDLSQADIEGTVIVDGVQVFGGVELVVPGNWEVVSDVTSIFGGIEDKRPIQAGVTPSGKRLVLTGTCVFGGIEIKSY